MQGLGYKMLLVNVKYYMSINRADNSCHGQSLSVMFGRHGTGLDSISACCGIVQALDGQRDRMPGLHLFALRVLLQPEQMRDLVREPANIVSPLYIYNKV